MTDRVPLRRWEYEALLELTGAQDCINRTGPIEHRAPSVVKAREIIGEAYSEMASTIPVEKLNSIRRDLDKTRVYIKIEAPGIETVDGTAYRYVKAETLNRLIDFMANNACLLCDKSEEQSRKCPYRFVMEDAIPHEVDYKPPDGCCKWSGLVLGLEGA